ncbi:MAG: hypothetical protein US74_C0016G0004 [Parcubacteria group bacterium GW2011_GWA2_38_13]|nr:MAG: hypothetical protein US74_C0016G0004 [Parcubacteria group bacterium GW2011_GWA2_38_13]
MKSHKHWKYYYELKAKDWFIMPLKVDADGVTHIFMRLEHNENDNWKALDISDGSGCEIDPNEHVIKIVVGNMH